MIRVQPMHASSTPHLAISRLLFFLLMTQQPPTSTLFPYTTLFRSTAQAVQQVIPEAVTKNAEGYLMVNNDPIIWTRSEEHTSELQSQFHLVCRLLLEKKKASER